MDTETFIERAIEVHGDAYMYGKTIHPGTKHCKVTITCPVHGDFEHRADMHLQGSGCKKCADAKRRMTTADFIAKAKQVHGDRFDYTLVDYRSSHEDVRIICELHGTFEQKAYRHLQGDGCRKCKSINHPSGYSYDLFKEDRELATSMGIFYILEYNFPGEVPFIRIGITRNMTDSRHRKYADRVTILLEKIMPLEDAFHMEQLLLHREDIQQFRYKPRNITSGVTECFTADVKPYLF